MNIPRSCFLDIITTDGETQRVKLVNEETIIGRHSTCTIQVGKGNLHVSNKHAAICFDSANIVVRDLQSTNGVFVNGKRITTCNLKHQDTIRFGTQGPRMRLFIENDTTTTAVDDLRIPAPDQTAEEYVENDHSDEGGVEVLSVIPDDDHEFDVSPSEDSCEFSLSDAKKYSPKNTPNKTNEPVSKPDPLSFGSGNLFDVAPSNDSIELPTPFVGTNSTMEISHRFRNNINNTQDYEILAKDPKKREKILIDEDIDEQQKRPIKAMINSQRMMIQTFLIAFSVIIVLLGIVVIWLAHGYFSYKSKFTKVRSLKSQIETFDNQFEKAFSDKETDSTEIKKLYEKLQRVQFQFDSIKATLDVVDRYKIYSDTIELFLNEIMNEFNETNYSIPHHMLERVKYYITVLTTQQRRSTKIAMQRKGLYFDEIEKVFTKNSIPPILAYVAMQESLLKTDARSSARAVGMWQFIPSTGRRFNLKINESVDERLDWKKSTVAAARYFKTLISLFGDGRGTLLAMAAYNAGEAKIKKALKDVEDPDQEYDFWYLYRTSTILAMETREYVPQILARIIIDKHPDRYGL